ncbi:MAG: hypothetical protein ACI936_003846 [Paraglaciecola sp.]|jgi:hypothetical protein
MFVTPTDNVVDLFFEIIIYKISDVWIKYSQIRFGVVRD